MSEDAKRRKRLKTEAAQSKGLLPPNAKSDKVGAMAWWLRCSRLEGGDLVWQLPTGVSVSFRVAPDGRQQLQASGHGGQAGGPQVARLKALHVGVAAGARLDDIVGLVVDHADADPTNDSLDNLRLVSHRQNSSLRGGSQLPGVSWNNCRRNWLAGIVQDGHYVKVGFSLTAFGQDARAYAVEARRELLRLAGAEDVLADTEVSGLTEGQSAIAIEKARAAWSRAMSRPAKLTTEAQRLSANARQNARNARIKARRSAA